MRTIGLLLLLVFLTGISVPNVHAAPPPARADRSASDSFTDFGFNIYGELSKAGSGNLFISPVSIAICLSMVLNGADSDTASQIASVLKMSGVTVDDINSMCRTLAGNLKTADPSVELTVANSVWCRKGVPFNGQFIKRVKDSFAAEVSDQMTAVAMNGWVSSSTKGKIQKIIDSVPENAVMYVINAIYFKGQWAAKFDTKLTKLLDFHVSADKVKKHPMMTQQGKYQYLKGDTFQAVKLPYGNRRLSMIVFLPDQASSLKDLQGRLNAAAWKQWMSKFAEREGNVTIPRFKCEYETDLNNSLKSLGMTSAFDPARADFSGISREKLYISRVKHKTFVDVNEQGTEAAAVTSTEMKCTVALMEPGTFRMLVDRPFFFAIVDSRDSSVLFMGSIVDPGN